MWREKSVMYQRLKWLKDQRVIFVQFEGNLTIEEIAAYDTEIQQRLNEATEKVHVIADLGKVAHFPVNMMRVREVLTYHKHARLGWHVLVNDHPNPLMNFFATAISNVAGLKVQHARTLEEAILTLSRVDMTLGEMNLTNTAA
jgi:hypothetical protein